MDYINLNLYGVPIRLRDKRGNVHSLIGRGPDGCDVEQTKTHHQIIQRCRYMDGRIIISYFTEQNMVVWKTRGDETFFLRKNQMT